MHVYAVMYGSIDDENEILHRLYHDQAKAAEHAQADMEQIFKDAPELYDEGFTHQMTTDSEGNPLALIMKGELETEYWRVIEQEVY